VEREKACPDTAILSEGGERECPERLNPWGIEYHCGARRVIGVELVNTNAGGGSGE